MKSNWVTVLAALALITGSTLLAAQDGDDADNTTGDADAAPGETAQPSAGETSTANGDTQTSSRNPFDYQSSEQISEDLSVSFPVDI